MGIGMYTVAQRQLSRRIDALNSRALLARKEIKEAVDKYELAHKKLKKVCSAKSKTIKDVMNRLKDIKKEWDELDYNCKCNVRPGKRK